MHIYRFCPVISHARARFFRQQGHILPPPLLSSLSVSLSDGHSEEEKKVETKEEEKKELFVQRFLSSSLSTPPTALLDLTLSPPFPLPTTIGDGEKEKKVESKEEKEEEHEGRSRSLETEREDSLRALQGEKGRSVLPRSSSLSHAHLSSLSYPHITSRFPVQSFLSSSLSLTRSSLLTSHLKRTCTAASFRSVFTPSSASTSPSLLTSFSSSSQSSNGIRSTPTPSSFSLLSTLLIEADEEHIPLIIAFNSAVWKFRNPAHDSRLERNSEWLVNRLVELASVTLSCIKPKARKKKKTVDVESESVAHNEKVARMLPDTALCYSDGSASPNPGPCGAGVSFFVRDPDMVIDFGASLGRGTNNYAELYGLGIIFTRLFSLRSSHPSIRRAVVFCDSKLALRAAVSSKNPISNGPITRAVRAAFLTVSRVMEIDLQWIRGHVQYGGNERVDRISKAFASVANNNFTHTFDVSFPASLARRVWEVGFPLSDVPVGLFLQNLPTPPPIGTIPVSEPSAAFSRGASVTPPTVSSAQIPDDRNSRWRIKASNPPTRRSARLNNAA